MKEDIIIPQIKIRAKLNILAWLHHGGTIQEVPLHCPPILLGLIFQCLEVLVLNQPSPHTCSLWLSSLFVSCLSSNGMLFAH